MICLLVGVPEAARSRLAGGAPNLRFLAPDEVADGDRRQVEAALVWDFRFRSFDELVERFPDLRWIHTASAGVDHVLGPAVVRRGILVSNSAGVFDDAIAEYVMALVHAHAKGLLETAAAQAARRWAYRETREVAGAAMLVVGAGRIGGAVAAVATAVGMRVMGVRRIAAPPSAGFEAIVSIGELDGALASADYVVLTLAATPATVRLFDAERLARLRPSAYLVNVARASVLDTAALVDALRSGRLAGAALDVHDEEPLPADSPLWSAPNLFISPHMAGDTVGWDLRVVEGFLENLRRFRAGEPLATPVDPARGY